jgi:hypothetical protein
MGVAEVTGSLRSARRWRTVSEKRRIAELTIERSVLAGWIGGASELLAPLIDAIQKHQS